MVTSEMMLSYIIRNLSKYNMYMCVFTIRISHNTYLYFYNQQIIAESNCNLYENIIIIMTFAKMN